jgi:hypothetical protein
LPRAQVTQTAQAAPSQSSRRNVQVTSQHQVHRTGNNGLGPGDIGNIAGNFNAINNSDNTNNAPDYDANIDHGPGDIGDRDTSDNESDASNTNAPVVRRRSNPKDSAPQATQLRFYSGSWVDVLKDAKNQYRLFIHTEGGFAERSRESLSEARNCVLEAIGRFQDEVGLPLDEGSLQFFFIGID